MEEDDLKAIFPAYGDRVAVKNFAKRSVSTGKQSLIERLKQKINNGKTRNDTASSSSSTQQQVRKVKKNTRIIEIGWLYMSKTDKKYKQIRARNGGGTRRVTIDKNSKCLEVLELAKDLFFPNGESVKGKITSFETELVDYKSHKFDNDMTVQEMYELAALPTLRFYLATCKLTDESDNEIVDTTHSSQPQNAISRTHTTNQTSFPQFSSDDLTTGNEQETDIQLLNESEEATSYLGFVDNVYLVRLWQ